MHRSLQPGPIEHDDCGAIWCHGWVHRLDGRSAVEAKELAAGWRTMLEQHGRTLTDEPTIHERGSYVLVELHFQPYPTGKQIRGRGTRGGERAAERRASWMTRLTGSMSSHSVAAQPV